MPGPHRLAWGDALGMATLSRLDAEYWGEGTVEKGERNFLNF